MGSRITPTQLQIIAFLAKMQAKAANGEPATVRAWWGDLPPFYPNPDLKELLSPPRRRP